MAKMDVLKHIEEVIKIARTEIKRQRSCKADQMRQLTGLVNSYTRLLNCGDEDAVVDLKFDNFVDGNATYYEDMIIQPDHLVTPQNPSN